MTHLEQDYLLKYVLELVDDQQIHEIEVHLSGCPECHTRVKNLEKETQLIKELESLVEPTFHPLPRRNSTPVFIVPKIAFALLVGFLTGFLASEYRASGNVTVVEQHLIPKSPPMTLWHNYSCQGMETNLDFDTDMLP